MVAVLSHHERCYLYHSYGMNQLQTAIVFALLQTPSGQVVIRR